MYLLKLFLFTLARRTGQFSLRAVVVWLRRMWHSPGLGECASKAHQTSLIRSECNVRVVGVASACP